MKLGRLFDGSGGFPLAGMLNGIALPCAVDVLRRIAKEGGTDHVEMAAEHTAAP